MVAADNDIRDTEVFKTSWTGYSKENKNQSGREKGTTQR